MKYLVVLCDGMADTPVPELQNRTPMEAAYKPNMDRLAQHGEVGMAKTIPTGMPKGSDIGNLSVMGFNPRVFYSGRSPLEAVSIGIDLAEDDVTFRCNLVTLSDTERYEDADMIDYSAGDISTEEASVLIRDFNVHIENEHRKLYPGVSYRHCLVLHHAETGSLCTPPHDITLKPIADHLPGGTYGNLLLDIMKRSRDFFKDHPVNLARIAAGKRPATSCWFWGEGTKPKLASFEETYGVKGGVVSAVDLIKGIGICAGLKSVDVPGATGYLDTNFIGKANAALDLLHNGCDFVYLHVEAPDECGHRYEIENKVKAIEVIDRDILGRILPVLDADGEPYSVLIMPDHPTPLAIRTHSGDPVPYVLYRSDRPSSVHAVDTVTEKTATATGVYVEEGHLMMKKLMTGDFC